MLDFTHFLTGSAWAATSSGAPAASPGPGAEIFGPQALVFLVILGIFYFLLIRPQQQKQTQQALMLKSLQKGDKIVTSGGIVGVVHKVDSDEHVTVEIADNVRVKIVRSTIADKADKPSPTTTKDDQKSVEKNAKS